MEKYSKLIEGIERASNQELETLIRLCIGRLLNLGSRTEQPGDLLKYEELRWLTIHADEELKNRNAARA